MNQSESTYARELFTELFDELSAIGLDSSRGDHSPRMDSGGGSGRRVVRPHRSQARPRSADRQERQPLGMGRPADDRRARHREPPGQRARGRSLRRSARCGQRADRGAPAQAPRPRRHRWRRCRSPTRRAGASTRQRSAAARCLAHWTFRRSSSDATATGQPCARRSATPASSPSGWARTRSASKQIGAFVEVHIEQDTLLTERDRPLALGTEILPHGRWRIDLRGEANHAGTDPARDPPRPDADAGSRRHRRSPGRRPSRERWRRSASSRSRPTRPTRSPSACHCGSMCAPQARRRSSARSSRSSLPCVTTRL